MDEIISLIVANGLWAVLFCALLAYELKDSRSRERKYTQTISTLTERLNTVAEIKVETTEIKHGVSGVSTDVKALRADAVEIKKKVVVGATKKRRAGDVECANNPA